MRALAFASLIACSAPIAPITVATDAAAPTPPSTPSTLAFTSFDEKSEDGVLVDDVTYRSGALEIHGIVCRPTGGGRAPLVMLDHGGFMGIDPTAREQCVGFAKLGIVAGVSSYRGEDGSDGSVEVCLGEVDDVLAMKEILRAQSWVNPARVATVGFSHGACIATMMALRDPTLVAAVDFFGPADIASAYDFWTAQLAAGEPLCPTCSSLHQYLVSTVKTALGGTPAQAPAAYDARSPVKTLASIAVPIMIFQGTDDYAVDLSQACDKRAAIHPRSFYLDASFALKDASACGGGFDTSALPTTFSDRAYLFVYEGQGHGFTGPAYDSAGKLAIEFLLSRLQ